MTQQRQYITEMFTPVIDKITQMEKEGGYKGSVKIIADGVETKWTGISAKQAAQIAEILSQED